MNSEEALEQHHASCMEAFFEVDQATYPENYEHYWCDFCEDWSEHLEELQSHIRRQHANFLPG